MNKRKKCGYDSEEVFRLFFEETEDDVKLPPSKNNGNVWTMEESYRRMMNNNGGSYGESD